MKANMAESSRITMYKEMYYFELNRKHKIHSDASLLIITLLAIIGASSFFFYRLSSLQEYGKLFFLYIISVTGLFLCVLVSIVYLTKIFHNYGYGYIPKAQEIEEYYQKLLSCLRGQKKKIEYEFTDFIIDAFCKYGDMNAVNNEMKLYYFSQARTAVIGSVIFIIICSLLSAILFIVRFGK